MPKILPDDVPTRTPAREPQLAEQLVELPTLSSFSSLWSRTSTFQFLVVESELLVFKVFPLDRAQQRRILLRNAFLSGIVEQIVDFLGGGLQHFRPGQSSSSSSHVPDRVPEDADENGEGGFSHSSPRYKKCQIGSARRVGTECGLYFIHPGSSCGFQRCTREPNITE